MPSTTSTYSQEHITHAFEYGDVTRGHIVRAHNTSRLDLPHTSFDIPSYTHATKYQHFSEHVQRIL